MIENIKKLLNTCDNFTGLIKFIEVEQHYQELNQEERKIIQDLAKTKIQELAQQNTK